MSAETSKWLNTNVLVGDVAERGRAWHYNEAEQGDESNHYDGAIPVEDIRRRLFDWTPLEAPIEATITVPVLDEHGVGTEEVRIVDPTRKAIIHSETRDFLGVFSNGYHVHGYDQWLLKNVADLVDDGALHVSSAGLLRLGAQAWAQISTGNTVEVAGDKLMPFITAATSLDGSMATTYKVGAGRVVCDNTLSWELASAGSIVRIKHSSKSLGRLETLRDDLGLILAQAETGYRESITAMTSEKVSWQRFDKWARAYAKLHDDLTVKARGFAEERYEGLNKLWKDDPRVTPWKGTAWGVVQTANTFEQHVAFAADDTTRALRNTSHMLGRQLADSDRRALDLLASV